MLIQRLAIIGVGLIGGSLARALKQAGECGSVSGCGRNLDNLRLARELGIIDHYSTNIAEAVAGADTVVVAVPLGAMAESFAALRDNLPADAVITDVGSAKASVVEAAEAHLGPLLPQFVPGHPIAGAEKSGAAAARADLFQQRRVILTPTCRTAPAAHAKITAMWRYTGAEVIDMGVEHHDRVLAATSHLPHLLAFSLVDMLATQPAQDKVFEFAAGGFRDFSRIASSDPRMWHDICLSNRSAILETLDCFQGHLQDLRSAIEQGDSARIEATFRRAKQARDEFYG